MVNSCGNKKKIRGWRNQVRKIDRWKNRYLQLDIDSLRKNGRSYVKIWIDPWFGLVKRNPPLWYCRLILEGLAGICLSWHKTLQELGEPYYLKLWVYDPDFMSSQVVAAIGDSVDFYQNAFNPNPAPREFPFDKYPLENCNLQEFNWKIYSDDIHYYEKLDELSPAEIMKLKRKAYKLEPVTLDDGEDVCYRVKKGDIFAGSL